MVVLCAGGMLEICRDMLEVYFIGERMIFLTDRGFICIFVRLVMKFI